MKENNEKKIKNCNEISKLIKAFPKELSKERQEIMLWKERDVTVKEKILLNKEVLNPAKKRMKECEDKEEAESI